MKVLILSDKPISEQMKHTVKDVFNTAINPNGAFKSVPWVKSFTGEIVYAAEPKLCIYKDEVEVTPRY